MKTRYEASQSPTDTEVLDSRGRIQIPKGIRELFDISEEDLITLELLVASRKDSEPRDLENTQTTKYLDSRGRFNIDFNICDFYDLINKDIITYRIAEIRKKESEI